MTEILRKLLRFMNRDLTGKTWEREVTHPYFGRMTYFGHHDSSKAYWEAELPLPGKAACTVTFDGTPVGPLASEEAFCREMMGDLDRLFEKCRDAFAREFPAWTSTPFPTRWQDAFALTGLAVPRNGDVTGEWEACYYAAPTRRDFVAKFRGGHVVEVLVEN